MHQFQQVIKRNPECTPNQTQLNADCILAVVDQMDFETLLAVAQINHFYSDICAYSFQRRFADRKIVIQDHFDEPAENKYFKNFLPSAELSNKSQIEITSESIQVKSVQEALRILRTFGHVIQKLKLKLTKSNANKFITIIEYVNKYCTYSLTELNLDIGIINVLQHFSRPFEKVESVSFLGKFPSVKIQTIPINKLFPSLRSLTLNIDSAQDNDYLTAYFPHLEHLNIETIPYNESGGGTTYMYGLLEKNSQIRNIRVNDYDADLLQKISALPQLDQFSFTGFGSIKTAYRFGNVEKFSTAYQFSVDPRNLFFPKLEELEVYFNNSRYVAWLEFLRHHLNLKRLRFHYMIISDGQFSVFTSKLQHLEEMSIYGMAGRISDIGVDEIIESIESHEKLMKFHLHTFMYYKPTDQNILRSRFSREWTITECGGELSLERKAGLSTESKMLNAKKKFF